MRVRIISVVVGIVVGGSLAAVGLALAPSGGSSGSGDTTTTTPATAASTWWHDPYETLVGTSALIVESLVVLEGEAIVTYRLEPITSGRIGAYLVDAEHPPIAPERWALDTTRGRFESASPSQVAQQVRFDVPADLVTGDVTGLVLEQYRVGLPYVYEVELPLTNGATAELDEGTTVGIVSVLPQRNNVQIGVGVIARSDSFSTDIFTIRGVGPQWEQPSFRTPSPPYNTARQLTLDEPTPPERVRLRVVGERWEIRTESVTINLGGIT